MGQTLEQKRAAHALKKVKSITKTHDGMYVSYVSSFPAKIVMNGLGQALVMQLAQANGDLTNSHLLLHDHVAEWLSEQIIQLKGPKEDVIQKLMTKDQQVYLRAQAEAMAYVNWLKQFARAYLKEKKEDANG